MEDGPLADLPISRAIPATPRSDIMVAVLLYTARNPSQPQVFL
jgi:hypothetical protein